MLTKTSRAFALITLILLILVPVHAQSPDEEKPLIRFAQGEGANFSDVVPLMVVDRLREQGYEVEMPEFADSALSIEAVATGQADMARSSFAAAWNAINSGGKIITVMEQNGEDFVVLSTSNLQTCEDLNGKTVALHNVAGQSSLLANYFFTNNCPDAEVEITYVRGSTNRVAAILSGAIDVTFVRLDATQSLLTEAPDDFHIFADLASEIPWILGSGVHFSTEFAEAHPQAVKDYIQTSLEVIREIRETPEILFGTAQDHLGEDDETINALIELYTAGDYFDPNGGLTLEDAERFLEFSVENEAVPDGLDLDNLIDRSYLDEVLDEIGRIETTEDTDD